MGCIARLRAVLPEGGGLPADVWNKRHQGLVALLALNAAGLVIFGIVQGYGVIHTFYEAGIVFVGAAAGWRLRNRPLAASVVVTLGLLTSSGILVHFARGSIEAHFHFFVMVTIIILYQDWAPFLLSIAYVVGHHALFGLVDPTSVFNHAAAIRNPVKWAIIHGVFILGATVAGLTVWKQNERLRDSYQNAARRLAEVETRQRQALDLNDNVLQNLAVADYAFQLGMPERGQAALKQSLAATHSIVSDLINKGIQDVEAGDLVRAGPTASQTT